MKKRTQLQAADFFPLSLRAIEKTEKCYKTDGAQALKAKKRGSHQRTSLQAKQAI